MTHPGITPHLVVTDAAKAIEFYKAAFGAEETSRMATPDGKIMHAQLEVNGHSLFLCDDFPEHCGGHSRLLPAGLFGPLHLHLGVPDTDAAMARAVVAGATVTMPAMDAFWGDRYGQVRDPFGHAWAFGTPLKR